MAANDVENIDPIMSELTEEGDMMEKEESEEATADEDEILNEGVEGEDCEEVGENGQEVEGSSMDVNDPGVETEVEESGKLGEAEGIEAECVEDGNTGVEESEMLIEDSDQSIDVEDEDQADSTEDVDNADITEDGDQASSTEDVNNADNTGDGDQADITENVDNADNTGNGDQADSTEGVDDADNTKDVDNAHNTEDEENAMDEGNDEDADEATALALGDFEVVDEAPGEDVEKQEDKPTEDKPRRRSTEKHDLRVPLCLKLYPLEIEDLQHKNVKAFINKSKFFSARFVGEYDSDKQGVLYVRYATMEHMEIAKKRLWRYRLRDGSVALLKKSSQRDHLQDEFNYIWKKCKPADDPEPVSVFVNNLPSYVTENMLKVLFPTATGIQLPQKNTGTIQGYAILEYASCLEARAVVRKNKQYAAYIGGNRLRLHIVGFEGITEQKTRTSDEKAHSCSPDDKSIAEKKETKDLTSPLEAEKNTESREEKNKQPHEKKLTQNKQQVKKPPQNKQHKQQEKKPPQNKQQQNKQQEKKPPQNKQQQNKQQEKKPPQNKQQEKKPPQNNQQQNNQQEKKLLQNKQQRNKQGEKKQQNKQPPSSQQNRGKRQHKDSVEGNQKKQRLGEKNESDKSQTVAKSTSRSRRGDRQRNRSNVSGQMPAPGNLSPGKGSKYRQLHQRKGFQRIRGPWPSDVRGQRTGTRPSETLGAMTTSELQALGLSNVNPSLLQSLKSLVRAQTLQTIGTMASLGAGMADINVDSGRANQFAYGSTSTRYPSSGRDVLMTGGSGLSQTSRASFNTRSDFHSVGDTGFIGKSGSYNQNEANPSKSFSQVRPARQRKRKKFGQKSVPAHTTSVYDGMKSKSFSKDRGGNSGSRGVHGGFEQATLQRPYSSLYSNSTSYRQSSQPASNPLTADVPQDRYLSEKPRSYSTYMTPDVPQDRYSSENPDSYSTYTTSNVPQDRYSSENPDSYSTYTTSNVPQDRYSSENPSNYSTYMESDVPRDRYFSENPVMKTGSVGGRGGDEQSASQPLKHSTLQLSTDFSGQQQVVGVKPAASDVAGNICYQDSRGDTSYSSNSARYGETTSSMPHSSSFSAGQSDGLENTSYSNMSGYQGAARAGHQEKGKEVFITNLPDVTMGELAEFVRQEMIRRYMCAEIDNPFAKLTPSYSNGKNALTLQFHDSRMAKAVVQELDRLNCYGFVLKMRLLNDKGFASKAFSNTSRKKNKMTQNVNKGVQVANEVFVGNVKRECTEGEFRQFFEEAIHELIYPHQTDFRLNMNFKPRRPFQFLTFDDPYVASEVVRLLNQVKFKGSLLKLRLAVK